MTLTSHILVGTDFSDASRLAVDAAKLLATQFGAKITVAHVFDSSPMAPLATSAVSPAAQLALEQTTELRIREELGRIREEDLAAVKDVETALIIGIGAADQLVKHANKIGADMIVVGTHGRTGLSHMLIGSVAEKVVRHATCPVLTLRSRA